MSADPPQGPPSGIPWAEFLDRFSDCNLKVHVLPNREVGKDRRADVYYLVREHDGVALMFPLEENWTRETRIGMAKMLHVCSRLKLPSKRLPLIM